MRIQISIIYNVPNGNWDVRKQFSVTIPDRNIRGTVGSAGHSLNRELGRTMHFNKRQVILKQNKTECKQIYAILDNTVVSFIWNEWAATKSDRQKCRIVGKRREIYKKPSKKSITIHFSRSRILLITSQH